MTNPTHDEEDLVPPDRAPEADMSHIPEHDPQTDHLDPDEQGGENHA